MTRRNPLLALSLAISLATFAVAGLAQQGQPPSAPPAQQPSVFRGGANFVVVDAYPQRDGRIIEGLTAADFHVLEDGKPQAIESFEFVRVEGGLPEETRRDPNSITEMRALAADPRNRVFVVFLDTLHTQLEGSNRIQRPIADALDSMVGSSDLFGLMTPHMRPSDLTLGRRMASVVEQLGRYWTWGERNRIARGPGDPMEDALTACFHHKLTDQGLQPWLVADGPVLRYFDEILIERRREDRTLGALEGLVDYLSTLRETRTGLLLISDGWLLAGRNPSLEKELLADIRFSRPGGRVIAGDQYSDPATCADEARRLSDLDNRDRFHHFNEQARRTSIAVYPIATAGLTATDAGAGARVMLNPGDPNKAVFATDLARQRDRVQALKTIAENTGGIAVVNTNDLSGGVRRIVDDTSAYYLLGYYSTDARVDGRLRRIEVKLRPSGVAVRARSHYVAAKRAAPPAASTVAAPAVGEALGALPAANVPVDLHVGSSATPGLVTIVVELASHHVAASGQFTRGGTVNVDLADAAGNALGSAQAAIAPGARAALLSIPVTDAGPWRMRARVLGAGAALDARAEVARAASAALGVPLLYRGRPSPRAPLQPAADPQFRRSERLHLELPILKALDRRSARVLDRRGQPLTVPATVAERSADGVSILTVDVDLAPFAEGEFLVDVEAGSGGEDARQLFAFRVIR